MGLFLSSFRGFYVSIKMCNILSLYIAVVAFAIQIVTSRSDFAVTVEPRYTNSLTCSRS